MKKLVPLLLFLVSIPTIYGQDRAIDPMYIKNLEQKIDTHLDFLTKEELNLIVHYSDVNPLISEHWDNKRFSPYGSGIDF